MIAFFNGPPGVGKSFHGTAYVLHCLDLGLRVAVSWDIVPPEGTKLIDLRGKRSGSTWNEVEGPVLFRFDHLDEVFGLKAVQIFKDEAQNDLGSRDWEKMALEVRIWMSEHRHYLTNLYLYTQHFKFVDIYPRRLALGNVYSLARVLHLTLEMPRPDADSETGELGRVDIFGIRVVQRPWRHLDIAVPWPSWWRLFTTLSKRVPTAYRTHAPHLEALATGKKPAAGGAARAPSEQTSAPF